MSDPKRLPPHPGGVTIAPADVWPILLYATRYALGRRSYAPADVCDYLRRYGHALNGQQRKQMAEEIRSDVKLYTRDYLGAEVRMPPDIVRGWLDVAGWLEEE